MANINYNDLKERVISHLKHIFDPEIPVNIYDLGLVYNIQFEQRDSKLYCNILMTLTSPGCPVAENLVLEAKTAAESLDDIDEAYVALTFSPPWDRGMISEEGKELMMTYGFVI